MVLRNQQGDVLPQEIENLILLKAQEKMKAKLDAARQQRAEALNSEDRAWDEVERLEERWAAQMIAGDIWKEAAMSIMDPNQLFQMDECAIV